MIEKVESQGSEAAGNYGEAVEMSTMVFLSSMFE